MEYTSRNMQMKDVKMTAWRFRASPSSGVPDPRPPPALSLSRGLIRAGLGAGTSMQHPWPKRFIPTPCVAKCSLESMTRSDRRPGRISAPRPCAPLTAPQRSVGPGDPSTFPTLQQRPVTNPRVFRGVPDIYHSSIMN